MASVEQVDLTPGCDTARPVGEVPPMSPTALSCGELNMLPCLHDDDSRSGPACHEVPRPALHRWQSQGPRPPPGLLPTDGRAEGALEASLTADCPGRTGIGSRRTPLSRAARAYVPRVPSAAPEETIGTCGKFRYALRARHVQAVKAPTTVMMRNLPYGYTRQRLIDLLNSHGFSGKYDFLYLPFDFESQYHVGYAFVNLTSSEHVTQFAEVFNGFNDWTPKRDHRICVVCWGLIQGLRANVERFETKQLTMEGIPEEWKPALFKDGVQIAFTCSSGTRRMLKGPGDCTV